MERLREQQGKLPHYPTVVAEKCTGCKSCIKSCRNHVLAFDKKTAKIWVMNPSNCLPGCRICPRVCPTGAIGFADEEAFVHYLRMRLAKIETQLGHVGGQLVVDRCAAP